MLLCLQDDCCRSVNYKKRCLLSENSTNCELLHGVAAERPEQLKPDENFNHLVILQPNKVYNYYELLLRISVLKAELVKSDVV